MVRDNLDRTVVQSQKQNGAAETQNLSPEEPAEPERTQRPERVNSESKEPKKSRLDLLFWDKLNLEDEPESWRRVSTVLIVKNRLWMLLTSDVDFIAVERRLEQDKARDQKPGFYSLMLYPLLEEVRSVNVLCCREKYCKSSKSTEMSASDKLNVPKVKVLFMQNDLFQTIDHNEIKYITSL